MLSAIQTVVRDAVGHFIDDDGLAIASHVALNVLMALFPFFIFLTAFAGYFGTAELAAQVTDFLFDLWPDEVAEPIAKEVSAVLTRPRGDLLTFGAAVAFFLASNGVEALRTALNRAYRVTEFRNFLVARLQSLFFVVLGAIGLLSLAFLIVLGPVLWRTALAFFPLLAAFERTFVAVRLGGGTLVLFVALLVMHLWLPTGRRSVLAVLPGIVLTLVLWLAGGIGFAAYLENYAVYSATYAGLAGAMIAIVFLYLAAVAFILGAELNAAISKYRNRLKQDLAGT